MVDAGAGKDSVAAGAGNDSVTSGAGSDTINAGAGNDTVALAGNLTALDSVDGGDDTDTLMVNAAFDGADALNVSGFEALTFSSAGSTTIDSDTLIDNNIATITLAGGAAETVAATVYDGFTVNLTGTKT